VDNGSVQTTTDRPRRDNGSIEGEGRDGETLLRQLRGTL
jgi:hypothetical protein